MPIGVLLGYQQHSRQTAVVKKQLQWSAPFRKRLWQKIVEQKIANQAAVFAEIRGVANETLKQYTKSVQSGDPTNREGVAAREYFQCLLPVPIVRSNDDHINAALNYGYALIRGVAARSLASYGFPTSVGIHHDSELNNFNLADDIIEAYRPFIDRYVCANISQNHDPLTREERIGLIQNLVAPVTFIDATHILHRAIESTVQSLVTASNENDFDKILLPKL